MDPEAARSSRAGHPEAPIPGVSAEAVASFCDALEFAVYGHPPTAPELASLRSALLHISREALAAGLTPERMLIGLKKVWTTVCRRATGPDMFDPLWHRVVSIALSAYELRRAAAQP